jgi:predicted amidophosphoribosyltransferase
VSIVIFFLLALIAAGFIVYPLLPGRKTFQPAPVVTDGDIEQAVRDLRRAQPEGNERCPSCGRGYEPGDRFCVGCGQTLSQADSARPACPSCGAASHAEDRFCAKCGATLPTREGT